ncbi:hypothetical protein FRC07_008042, partial [Ceratobasidium sp. 392]
DLGIKAGDSPKSSGLLVHTFSNGGAVTLSSVARYLAEASHLSPTSSALPAQVLIFDSLPGIVDLRIAMTAFTTSIRSPTIRALAKLYYGTLYFGDTIWRRTISQDRDGTAFFGRIHHDLNDSKLLPQQVPRTYLYSDVDPLVQTESVEGHAKKVKESLAADGIGSDVVKLVKFKGSQHVSHARQDPQRYWDAVIKTWEASCHK